MSDQPGGNEKRPVRDMRRFQRESERRFLVGALVLLVLVGGALIGVILGPAQALGAAPCLLAGAAILLGLYFVLAVMDRWINR